MIIKTIVVRGRYTTKLFYRYVYKRCTYTYIMCVCTYLRAFQIVYWLCTYTCVFFQEAQGAHGPQVAEDTGAPEAFIVSRKSSQMCLFVTRDRRTDHRNTIIVFISSTIIVTIHEIAMLAGHLSEESQANLQSRIQYRQGLC